MRRPVLLAAVLTIAPAAAQQPPAPDAAGTFSATFENDVFGGGTDRYYSNGFLFSWRSPSAGLPAPLAELDRGLDRLFGPGQVRWGLSFGQNIYTPQDTERRNPDPRDRPYAGYLYGAATVAHSTGRAQTLAELQLGVVGPAALGEFVQNNYHALINVRPARGWDYQLKDEAAASLLLERRWRLPLGQLGGIETEAIPVVTGVAGNVAVYAGAGALLRIGTGLDADWGPVRIRPALAGSGSFQPQRAFGWYAFAGLEGRAVARDIFLDGNTFRDSRSVERRPFVFDAQLGAAILWRGARLAYTQVLRTEEFYGQRGRQSFGSLSLSFRF